MASQREQSPYYGCLQQLVDSLFETAYAGVSSAEIMAAEATGAGAKVRRLDVVLAAEALDFPDELREVVNLLPPGTYTRSRLCTQLNSAVGGHAWGQRYGTVE